MLLILLTSLSINRRNVQTNGKRLSTSRTARLTIFFNLFRNPRHYTLKVEHMTALWQAYRNFFERYNLLLTFII